MRPSIIQLRQFYSSRLGRQVKKTLRHQLLKQWQLEGQETVLGVGYAPPLLRVFDRASDKRSAIAALMPADQGAIYWPVHTDNRSILGDELQPPFAPNSLQRVLLVHALEFMPQPSELLRVYWEMLAPGGRLMVIVPNRFGLWAHSGRTPFARGSHFRMHALKDLLEDAQFTLRESCTLLYAPPSRHRLWVRIGGIVEWLGGVLLPGFGGVILIEAEKQIYANLAVPVVGARRASWKPAAGAVPITERR